MTLPQALFVVLTVLLTAALTYLSYRSARVLPQLPVGRSLLLSPADLVARGVVILACLALGWISGATPAQLGWTSGAPLRDTALGALMGMAAHVALYPLGAWAARRLGPRAYSDALLRHILPRTRGEWPGVALALSLAVLLEELLFRSLLLGGMLAALAPSAPSGVNLPALTLALGGALVFGLMHAPQGWLGMLIAGGIGFGLSLLFLITGTLLAPFAAHYAFNLAQLARAYREPKVSFTRPSHLAP